MDPSHYQQQQHLTVDRRRSNASTVSGSTIGYQEGAMMGASTGMMGASMGTLGVSGREPVSKQIQSDWANREYVEVITSSIKKMTDFLSSFDQSCRGKIALINERLTKLERSVDWLEATVNREGNVGTP